MRTVFANGFVPPGAPPPAPAEPPPPRDEAQLMILGHLAKHPHATVGEMSEALGFTTQHLYKTVSTMHRRRLLASSVRMVKNKLVATYHVRGPHDHRSLNASVLDFIQQNPGATAAQVRAAVDRCNIYEVLGKLHKAGYLRREQDVLNTSTGKLCYRYWRNI